MLAIHIFVIYLLDMLRASIDYAVLGMVSLRPMTGYEIKKAYARGPANFMPISFGQIYPVLARLEKEKLIRQETKPGSRGSIGYAISQSGERALREWVASSAVPAGYRELLLRLFFASPGEIQGLRGAVTAFRDKQQAALDHYDATGKWLDEAHGQSPRLPIWKLVMDYGILQSQAYLRWAEGTLAFMDELKKGKNK